MIPLPLEDFQLSTIDQVGAVSLVALANNHITWLEMGAVELLGLLRSQHCNIAPERDVQQPVGQNPQIPFQAGESQEAHSAGHDPRRNPSEIDPKEIGDGCIRAQGRDGKPGVLLRPPQKLVASMQGQRIVGGEPAHFDFPTSIEGGSGCFEPPARVGRTVPNDQHVLSAPAPQVFING